MQRLAQRGAGMLLVELRPEQRQQAVTAVEALGPCGGEVGEEREASGLAEQGPYVASIGAGEAQPPEHAELDHARPRRCAARFRASRVAWGRRYGRRDGRITR